MKMLFYDFEVFKHDWLIVIIDMDEKRETIIINNPDKLKDFYEVHKNRIWAGFNSRHYDQYILKGILCGFNPKTINDYIIVQGNPGWKFSGLFRRIPLNNYDVMNNLDRGLKFFEGSMGNNIQESSVPFNIDRPLTNGELTDVIEYCRYDVEQTIEVFLQRKDDFQAHMGLMKLAGNDLSLLGRTKPQLAAIILEAEKKIFNDEFNIDFPETIKINKYTQVLDWYKNPDNRNYGQYLPGRKTFNKTQLEIMVAGVPHVFGWGGIHGAIDKYTGSGYYLNMDVASLYPSLMINYGLLSRAMKNPDKYEDIYHKRLAYKAENNPLQAPLKLVLNSTYGVMKDKNNPLFDPLQANRVCVYGQLLLLDLIEKLEPYCEIIQSNTDGVLVKLPDGRDDTFYKIDDICYEWEQRTGLILEFEEFRRVYQKDVNNYVIVAADGSYKSKGAWVKQLNNLDYDLPIVNQALINYMVKGIPIADTINSCDQLKEFQMVTKITYKYKYILYGNNKLNEKTIRIFASQDDEPGVMKVHAATLRPAKIPNSPESCFIFNGDVNSVKVPKKMDKNWYIELAEKRLSEFGVT